jgi:ATP-binding cassette, subfamily B, bacterial MsbA
VVPQLLTTPPNRVWLAPFQSVQIFRAYFSYLKPVIPLFVWGLLAGVVFGISSGFGIPYMIYKVFPVIFGDDAVPLESWQIWGWAAFIPLIMTIRGLSGFANTYLISLCGVKVLEAIRMDIFRKFQALPIAYVDRMSSGELLSRCQADTAAVQNALTAVANDLVKQPLGLLGAVGFLIVLSFWHAQVVFLLLSLAIIPLCIFPVLLVGKKMLKRARQTQAQLGTVTGYLSQNLRAAREVRSYNQQAAQAHHFQQLINRLFRVQLKAIKYSKGLTPAIEVLSAIGVAVAFVYAYRAGISKDIFLALIGALYLSYEPIKKIGNAFAQLQQGRGAMERLDEILNEPETIQDPTEPRTIGRLHGNIRFHNVGFSYGDATVLDRIEIDIPAGTVCALVGASGAGKTTFSNLIPRFYDPTAGHVSVDSIDIRELRQGDLRQNIALVSQFPFLFDDTVLNNILIGRPGASREEAIEAARNAYAHDFIQSLPHGYDTKVGEDAYSLSGGQRQRLAIARAFLKDAPILILDEATSALDSESEEKIRQALARLSRRRTVIMIAHRFSTILHADMILVFEAGRIVARGRHAELYESNALYRSLYDKQAAQP